VIWAIIGGILGARVFWVFVSPYLSTYLKNPLSIFAFWEGGLSFEGMILGGMLAIFISARAYKISFRKILDASVLGVSIGYGIGKLACFLMAVAMGFKCHLGGLKYFHFLLYLQILNLSVIY